MKKSVNVERFLERLNRFYETTDAEIKDGAEHIDVLGTTIVRTESGAWIDRNRYIDVTVSDETNSIENPGYDVDVHLTYDGSGLRVEDLSVCGLESKKMALEYVNKLKETYVVKNIFGCES